MGTSGPCLMSLMNLLITKNVSCSRLDLPLYNPDDCDNNGNYTCETSLQNIVDVYYFDVQDTFSCKDQCKMLPDCKYWTHFDVMDDPQPHHKCFLYKDCTIKEPCASCETGGPV